MGYRLWKTYRHACTNMWWRDHATFSNLNDFVQFIMFCSDARDPLPTWCHRRLSCWLLCIRIGIEIFIRRGEGKARSRIVSTHYLISQSSSICMGLLLQDWASDEATKLRSMLSHLHRLSSKSKVSRHWVGMKGNGMGWCSNICFSCKLSES